MKKPLPKDGEAEFIRVIEMKQPALLGRTSDHPIGSSAGCLWNTGLSNSLGSIIISYFF